MRNDFNSSEHDSVGTIIFEMSALNAALSVIDADSDAEEARFLVRKALKRKAAPETPDEHVVSTAMRHISGEKVTMPTLKACEKPWDRRLLDVTAASWIAWVQGDNSPALTELPTLLREEHEALPGEEGAIRLMSICFWGEAVVQLAKGERDAAHRYFRRAIELGSQFGTETHPTISWSYAASFFEKRSTSEG